eukprot:Gregarina_sp_Poly_1__1587@NODE_13_length_23366_cov_172_320786_g11_i0_p4_GENE_NODE_13_length_23366_cov_172_320786_g11_i0NODE_13_length_23366_cov_172_320786_g11_i0_p4_ORF_typecomplete_len479_score55_32DUF4708/PF15813_5/8_7e09_NODE_13_length_23366_cov_172_320786_g11_i01424615682
MNLEFRSEFRSEFRKQSQIDFIQELFQEEGITPECLDRLPSLSFYTVCDNAKNCTKNFVVPEIHSATELQNSNNHLQIRWQAPKSMMLKILTLRFVARGPDLPSVCRQIQNASENQLMTVGYKCQNQVLVFGTSLALIDRAIKGVNVEVLEEVVMRNLSTKEIPKATIQTLLISFVFNLLVSHYQLAPLKHKDYFTGFYMLNDNEANFVTLSPQLVEMNELKTGVEFSMNVNFDFLIHRLQFPGVGYKGFGFAFPKLSKCIVLDVLSHIPKSCTSFSTVEDLRQYWQRTYSYSFSESPRFVIVKYPSIPLELTYPSCFVLVELPKPMTLSSHLRQQDLRQSMQSRIKAILPRIKGKSQKIWIEEVFSEPTTLLPSHILGLSKKRVFHEVSPEFSLDNYAEKYLGIPNMSSLAEDLDDLSQLSGVIAASQPQLATPAFNDSTNQARLSGASKDKRVSNQRSQSRKKRNQKCEEPSCPID